MCRKCRDIFNTAQVIGGGNLKIFIFINAITKQNGADNIFLGGMGPLKLQFESLT